MKARALAAQPAQPQKDLRRKHRGLGALVARALEPVQVRMLPEATGGAAAPLQGCQGLQMPPSAGPGSPL